MFILIPSLLLILAAFELDGLRRISRFSWRFNVTLLLIFTAGNLLPRR